MISHGQCIEQHGSGEAFLPVLEALGRLCRGVHGKQILHVFRQHAPTWLVQMPSLLRARDWEALQGSTQHATRERMLRELAEALEMLTREHPMVLVLEDLHWSDVSTLDLLAFLARRKEPARLLVIGVYRPVEMLREGHPLKSIVQELYAHRLATEFPLRLLSEGDVAAYLRARLEREPSRNRAGAEGQPLADACGSDSHRALVRTLHHRTGGNALFLVSLVSDLIERRLLLHTITGWELTEDPIALGNAIPDTIRHLVARQSERLSPEERGALEAASVAGMEFSATAVAAALTKTGLFLPALWAFHG